MPDSFFAVAYHRADGTVNEVNFCCDADDLAALRLRVDHVAMFKAAEAGDDSVIKLYEQREAAKERIRAILNVSFDGLCFEEERH